MEIKEIIKLCNECFGVMPEDIVSLPGAGSSRRYWRVYLPEGSGDDPLRPRSVIATFGHNRRENETFCSLARTFNEFTPWYGNRLAPKIYAVSKSGNVYLQQDCGDISFLDYIKEVRKNSDDPESKLEEPVRYILGGLLAWQNIPYSRIKDELMTSAFGVGRVRSDLFYFKNCFLRPSGLEFDEELLDADIEAFAHAAADVPPQMTGFMYRDFQSRNVMVNWVEDDDISVSFIDFQGGMIGPMVYDAISFLWQAKAGFSKEFRLKMLGYYLNLLSGYRDISPDEGMKVFRRLQAVRVLQVLGAYGFRGLIQHKAHFIESIAQGLENLAEVVSSGVLNKYPELRRCCRNLLAEKKYLPSHHEGLVVEVLSFSFKKGYPENFTGNGGGFVFDCRGMHNPGRYEEYRNLTGMDKEVAEFLEERGEVQEFLRNVEGLVDPTVATYLRRDFRNLQVAFGCTGGRHRSVYCAQQLAIHLKQRFPEVTVDLVHREQNIKLINVQFL